MDRLDDLLDAAREGDEAAFGALYEQLRVPVFRYLVAATADRHGAEDMLADVFVDVARGLRTFEGGADAFVGWIFTIARHDVADRRRQERRRTVRSVAEVPEPAPQPDPADRVAERLDANRVHDALDALTDEQREVVLMRFVAERSLAEVAAAIGKPVGAVKSMQHRALATMKRALEATT